MNKRDTKFVSRIIVIFVFALVFSLGARIVLESAELSKVVPQNATRDLLIFIGPLAALAGLQYTFAVKSFGIRSLLTEALAFAGPAFVFLAITVSYYLGAEVMIDGCRWWQIGCVEDVVVRSNRIAGVGLSLAGVASIGLVLWRERILRLGAADR